MKAIVHIGTEKTGTTSIQKFLHRNRRKLRNAGFHFIQSAGEINNRALPVYCLSDSRNDDFYLDNGLETLEQRNAFKAEFIRAFEAELGALPASVHTVVISSEHFHSRIRSDEEMDNVHRLLTRYFSDIRVVCYLREQVVTLTSYYSTSLKSGGTERFSEFMRRCTPESHYFNYQRMLENWGQRFGFDALEVALFDRAAFLNGDLLDDFTARLDAGLVGKLSKKIEVENESLLPGGQMLLLAINRAFPRREVDAEILAVRDACGTLIYRSLRGPGQQPSPEEQRALAESFAECNEWVRAHFFPEAKRLFAAPGGRGSTAVECDEPFVRTLTELMTLLKQRAQPLLSAVDYATACSHVICSVIESVMLERAGVEAGLSMLLGEEDAKLFRRAGLHLQHRDPATALQLLKLAAKVHPGLVRVAGKIEELQDRLDNPDGKNDYFLAYYFDGTETDAAQRESQMRELLQWIASLELAQGVALVNFPEHRHVSAGDGSAIVNASPVGYTMIRAESLDAAEAVARTCPALSVGVSIKVSLMAPLIPLG